MLLLPHGTTLSALRNLYLCQVALGRCALDPLPVLASLCGPSAEILAMKLHPLKDLLPRQELAAAAERVCCTATCQVCALLGPRSSALRQGPHGYPWVLLPVLMATADLACLLGNCNGFRSSLCCIVTVAIHGS